METMQGSPDAGQSADQSQGSPAKGQSATALPIEVPQQFIVPQAPDTTPAVPQEQGQSQGLPAQTIQADANELARLRNAQSIADQRQAEIYRLQQELQTRATPTPQQDKNPYDPQSNYEQWDEWRVNKIVERAVENQTKQLVTFAQRQQQQQQEITWQQAHPSVDINLVKQWGQINGVNNLDHAFTLMNLNNTLQTERTQAAQSAFNQFKQPQNVATPVRGGQQATGTINLSYEAMAKEYTESYGKAYEQWSPALRQAFDRETASRLR
jgi:hypothetical protein